MRITVVGGGPAGLYFAILMQKAQPGHDITVLERNRADDTFGFGVVFSDETLGHFHDADPETYFHILDNFAYWDEIHTHYRGEVIRSTVGRRLDHFLDDGDSPDIPIPVYVAQLNRIRDLALAQRKGN